MNQKQNLDGEAFREDIIVFSYCSDAGYVSLGLSYTNEESGGDQSKTVNAYFTDQQTGASTALSSISPGQTKSSQIITNQRTLVGSQVTVDVERINNPNRMTTAIVGYDGTTCQAPTTATPTPTIQASPTPSPTSTATPTPSPTIDPGIGGIDTTPTPTPTPTATASTTPTSSPSASPSPTTTSASVPPTPIAEFNPEFGNSGFGSLANGTSTPDTEATSAATTTDDDQTSFNWLAFFLLFPIVFIILAAIVLYLYQLTLRKPLEISIPRVD